MAARTVAERSAAELAPSDAGFIFRTQRAPINRTSVPLALACAEHTINADFARVLKLSGHRFGHAGIISSRMF